MKRDELRTPGYLIEKVQTYRTIDLDPCASSTNIKNIPARRFYTTESNGLSQPWQGFVFMNPPFTRIEEWALELARHVDGGIAIYPTLMDARWFQDLVLAKASAISFLRARPIFKGHTRSVTFDVCVALYGDMYYSLSLSDQIYRFTNVFQEIGPVLACPLHG